MRIPKRFFLYSAWMKNELFSNKTVAEVYDIAASKEYYDTAIIYEKRKSVFRELLEPLNFKNKTVLDLACGTGVFLDAIETNKLTRVVGVDVSSGMLAKAKPRLDRFPNLELRHESFMDFTKIPGKFDFILLGNASRFITEGKEEKFFKEVASKLTPDGYFIITTDYLFADNLIGKTLTNLLAKISIRKRYNSKTAWTWDVEKLLTENFEIISSQKYHYWDVLVVKHKFIVCKAK